MRLQPDLTDKQDIYREILRAPKGIDSPFYIAGSWMIERKEQIRIQRAMKARAERDRYPYKLHWMHGPIMVGWWETMQGEDDNREEMALRKEQIDDAAKHGVYPESRKYERRS